MLPALAASSCLTLAATSYHVRKTDILAVLAAPPATGGVGPMHIPSAWLPILARVGFAPNQVVANRCTNIAAGTWILAFEAQNEPASAPAPALAPPVPHAASPQIEPCITKAAKQYNIPATLLSAVLRTEGGQVGKVHYNANGSYDIGPAQINSIWLPQLAKAGITRTMLLNNACLNITVGAWILGNALAGASPKNPAVFWQHVGDYNSHTPFWNQRYALKVWHNLR